MKAHSDSALATVLLTTRLVEREAKPLSSGEFWTLLDEIDDPAMLLGDARDVEPRIHDLMDAGTALAMKLEELETSGIRVLTPYDDGYPHRLRERLRSAAPAVLHVAGSVELLADDGIGIVGSRNVGVEARDVASSFAQIAVRAGMSVVSGAARGIDQVAMDSALGAEGTVVGLPADAMTKVLRDPSVRRAITDGRLCLASPYAPSAGFNVGTAMARNKLIYGLSRATVVITTDREKGGTWTGATEALEKGYGTVAVWLGGGAGEGNADLVKRGAVGIEAAEEITSLHETRAPDPVQQLKLM